MRNLNQDKSIKSIIPLQPSNFDTIDGALYDFINDNLTLHCSTNKGWNKVPIIWAGMERAKQAKDNPDIMDINNSLIFPILSIQRETPTKNQASKGKFYANIPQNSDYKGGSIVIGMRIKQDKTQNFANADAFKLAGGPDVVNPTNTIDEQVAHVGRNSITFPRLKNKVVYEIASMIQPVYFEIPYKIKIKTEYQQQMNEIVQPFIIKSGSTKRVMISKDGWRYEAFIQEEFVFKTNIDDMSTEPRSFETEITIKVYGYVIGGSGNDEKPYISVRENIVEVKIGRERVIFEDQNIRNVGDALAPRPYIKR